MKGTGIEIQKINGGDVVHVVFRGLESYFVFIGRGVKITSFQPGRLIMPSIEKWKLRSRGLFTEHEVAGKGILVKSCL